jgi:hypothetical protein
MVSFAFTMWFLTAQDLYRCHHYICCAIIFYFYWTKREQRLDVRLQNGSAQAVSSTTLLKNRNFNAPPKRCREKTALELVSTASA